MTLIKRVLLCSKIFFLSAKKSIITTGVMVLLASLCLNMLFVLLFDYTMYFDRIHQEKNVEDNVFIFSSHDLSALKDTIREKLDEKAGIDAYDLLDVQYFWGGCKYGEGTLLSTILPTKKTEA